MDINLLKTFLTVYQTRHFGNAAEQLCVTQAAVSARIQLLEKQLNIKLFKRIRNDLKLTHAGEQLLPYAESILATWQNAKQQISPDKRNHQLLTIYVDTGLWFGPLSTWMRHIYNNHTNVNFTVQTTTTEELATSIKNGEVILAITLDNLQHYGLEMKVFTELSLVMVSSQQHMTLQQGLNKNYIYINWGTDFEKAHTDSLPISSPFTIKAETSDVALNFILNVGGQAYLPEVTALQMINQKKLFRVIGAPILKRKVYCAYSPKTSYCRDVELLLNDLQTEKHKEFAFM